jgi:hypothetical protein
VIDPIDRVQQRTPEHRRQRPVELHQVKGDSLRRARADAGQAL